MDAFLKLLYWAATGAALALFLIASVGPAAAGAGIPVHRWLPRPGPRGYAGWMWLIMGLGRLPGILSPGGTSDEGQMIAGARTLFTDLVFWRSVDGHTGGPLVFYGLMPLEPMGLLDYAGIRIVGTLLIGGAVWFSYRGLRAVWGDGLARLGVLPAALFFALATRQSFSVYSTEHVALLLLAVGLSGLLSAMVREGEFAPWGRNWLAAGVALGAVPFAKLQAVRSPAAKCSRSPPHRGRMGRIATFVERAGTRTGHRGTRARALDRAARFCVNDHHSRRLA